MSDHPETGSSQQEDSASNKETENPQDDCFQFLCFICKEKSETPLQPQFGGTFSLEQGYFFALWKKPRGKKLNQLVNKCKNKPGLEL